MGLIMYCIFLKFLPILMDSSCRASTCFSLILRGFFWLLYTFWKPDKKRVGYKVGVFHFRPNYLVKWFNFDLHSFSTWLQKTKQLERCEQICNTFRRVTFFDVFLTTCLLFSFQPFFSGLFCGKTGQQKTMALRHPLLAPFSETQLATACFTWICFLLLPNIPLITVTNNPWKGHEKQPPKRVTRKNLVVGYFLRIVPWDPSPWNHDLLREKKMFWSLVAKCK